MAHLTLAGVSDDGRRLRLVDDEGTEHTVDIDERLRAALRGPAPRRLETTMDSALRPRDIQARIRAGETPEAVAEAAGTPVEKIMAFAAPVLAERQHVAQRAQRSSVRRLEGSPSAARTLGDAVATHLRSVNVDPETVEWDACRREDGRWSLSAAYASEQRTGTAELTYDAPGNYVTLDNDDARWLVGEAVAAGAQQRDDLGRARQRRLTAVHPEDEELPLGEDAIDLVSEQPVEAFLADEAPAEPDVAAEEASRREEAADVAAKDEPAADRAGQPTDDRPTDDRPTDDQPTEEQPPVPPARRPVRKSRGRASVPSWDEIMFGGSSGTDRT